MFKIIKHGIYTWELGLYIQITSSFARYLYMSPRKIHVTFSYISSSHYDIISRS